MSEITRSWIENKEISPADRGTPVNQVYVWLVTTDEHMVVVSKDGKEWQLPGGKPEQDESLTDAAVREVLEETGIDISPYRGLLEFFGYYVINEPDADPVVYLQVRLLLNLPLQSSDLNLNINQENHHQATEDVIRHVGAISIHDVASTIPWMPKTDEYHCMTKRVIGAR